jgi:hypothetical protein
MAVTGVEPGAALVMKLSSELMDAQAVIRRQRRAILALACALHTQQRSVAAMTDVLDILLSEPGDADG